MVMVSGVAEEMRHPDRKTYKSTHQEFNQSLKLPGSLVLD